MYCGTAVNNASMGKIWQLSTITENVLITRSPLLKIKNKTVEQKNNDQNGITASIRNSRQTNLNRPKL